MHPLDAFSPDYFTARQRFRTTAGRHGWSVESHPIAAQGPDGEELVIDVAISPHKDDKTLVTSSGVHGVEGPFGSAVQLGLLERWGSRPLVRCVMIHAVNPFGFVHRRRFNEENVDLNRNFLLAGHPYSGSPDGYADLDGVLNPPSPPTYPDLFPLRIVWGILRRRFNIFQSYRELRTVIASGQYQFPKGMFFGGHAASESVQIIGTHFERWLGPARDVVHLDFHTGLGRWSTGKLLIDYPLTDHQRRWLTDWFGTDAYEEEHQNDVAYPTRGGFGPWCVAHRGHRDYLFACAEFGTYSGIPMLTGLRAESRAHLWGQRVNPKTERAKKHLAQLFCPENKQWRNQVLQTSWDFCERAVHGLRSKTDHTEPHEV
jgi:hypothetical protein